MNQSDKNSAGAASEIWQRCYPPELCGPEQQQVRERRAVVNEEIARQPDDGRPRPRPIADDAPAVGFALSGGGIRSATFCLGLFQALARHRLIRRIDYLSTVSGGGYFGSFLGRLYSRDYASPATVEQLLDPALGKLDNAAQPPIEAVQWLRLNGRYMAPKGGGDLLTAVAVALRNLVALQLVIASTVLLAFLLLEGLEMLVEHCPWLALRLSLLPSFGQWLVDDDSLLMPSPLLDLLPPLLGLLVIPPGWAYWLIERRIKGEFHPFWGMLIVLAIATLGLWYGLQPGPGGAIQDSRLLLAALTLAVIASLTVIAEFRAHRRDRSLADAGRSARGGARLLGLWRLFRGHQVDDRGAYLLNADTLYRLSRARAVLTTSLVNGLLVVAVIAALGLIDTLGLSLYRRTLEADGLPIPWFGALVAALAPVVTRLSSLRSLLERFGGNDSALQLPVQVLVTGVALTAWAALLIALSALAQGISYGFEHPDAVDVRPWAPVLIALVPLIAFAGLFGRTWTFLNRSSHASLYSARLTRAYLGASNPERHRPSQRSAVTDPLPGDDDSIPGYVAGLRAHGGPLHYINVTINETASELGKTVLRDRKGIGMAVGPQGLSAGVNHHAIYLRQPGADDDRHDAPTEWVAQLAPVVFRRGDYSMFASPADHPWFRRPVGAERMSLGQWIGVSGAAFSTGLGSGTSLGMSLLFGFANIRLGRWWDSGRRMPASASLLNDAFRRLLPVQAHLANELSARFHGPEQRRWYLSDGGHFENMGAYELIRRRLPMIVIVDAEADPGYRYEGLANLVRKARMDFGATIEVLDSAALDAVLEPALRPLFGSLDELRPEKDSKFSQARAALAEVRYDDDPAQRSLILYIKPTMAAGDPVDVREYHARNDSFPQQTTADQFFDEAQWESYRRLGERIGSLLFADADDGADPTCFRPARLRPVFADQLASAGSRDTSSSLGSRVALP